MCLLYLGMRVEVCVMNTGTANLQQESGLLIASVFFGLKSCRDSSRFS